MLLTGTGRLAMARQAGSPGPMTLTPWAVEIASGQVRWVGHLDDAPADVDRVELGEQLVTPGLIDSHTHPVFAGDRSDEAAARLEGAPYTGGGILRTVTATRATNDDALAELVGRRLRAALGGGVTTIECKSGYGLSLDEEVRHLHILDRVAATLPVRVILTFLGAHAIPSGTNATEYAAHVADEMIPAVAAARLANFVDVFCDRGFFSLDDARRIADAARVHGLGLRLHAEQLALTGAAALGAQLGAASVDHLEQIDDAGVAAVAASDTVATLLPGPAIVMRDRLPPARALLDAGATVALASDANAGTFGDFGAMPRVIGLGATLLGMRVSEALAAATAGGAAALRLPDRGEIRAGAVADLVAWDAEHEGAFALRLGALQPTRTWIGGVEV
jgi:imidazolonepropionase